MGRRRTGGYRAVAGLTTVEVVLTTAVSGVLLLVGIPVIEDARRTAAMNQSAARIHGMLVRCRAVAVLRSRNCSVVFDKTDDGDWTCVVAEDGDGDGVRRRDILDGTDPVVGKPLRLEARPAGPGILPGSIPDPSGNGLLDGDPGDPIRAGRGNIVSFTPRGTATPSSIYISDRAHRMVVLRVYGGTGRIYRLHWRRGWEGWRHD